MSALKDNHVDDPGKVGKRLARARKQAGLSQLQLGLKAEGVSSAYISRIEVGARTPSPAALEALAGALDLDAHWLAWGRPDPTGLALERARNLVDGLRDGVDRRAIGQLAVALDGALKDIDR